MPVRASAKRRAPGMRREELAAVAGLSVDYVVRLEQGRAAHPSPQVVASLARALKLSAAERAHLHELAGVAEPRDSRVPEELTPSVLRMMDRLKGTPVAAFSAAWTLLKWNDAWATILPPPTGSASRNLAWRLFVDGSANVLSTRQQQSEFEEIILSDLRGAAGRYPHDEKLRALIDSMIEQSARFAMLWRRAVVKTHRSKTKTMSTRLGTITLDCDVFTSEGDLRIVVYTAEPGSESERVLNALQAPRRARRS